MQKGWEEFVGVSWKIQSSMAQNVRESGQIAGRMFSKMTSSECTRHCCFT